MYKNIFYQEMARDYTSKVCMNFDSSTGCEREMFGHLQHNNRVGDALIMVINVKIFRSRREYWKKILNYILKKYMQNIPSLTILI